MSTRKVRNIVILTGAGISVESGLPAFRTMSNGEVGWDTGLTVQRLEDVATPEAFLRDPARVHAFYDARREKLAEVAPNAAHEALGRLDRDWKGDLLLVTQNVDDLHERAGAKRMLHMHGELAKGWCLACDRRFGWTGPMGQGAQCPGCRTSGAVRPDIVWFGEIPYGMEKIEQALERCDLFVSIGTSGAVYPAAGFVQVARHCGARTLEMNLVANPGSFLFDESRTGKAGDLVPAWVEGILGGA